MRVIIAGSRTVNPTIHQLDELVQRSGFVVTVVLSGCALGVDQRGKSWAYAHGIPVEQYPADWTTHGRAAGPIRNREMAEKADALLAIWDCGSRGTRHMIGVARELGLQVCVYMPIDGGFKRLSAILAEEGP